MPTSDVFTKQNLTKTVHYVITGPGRLCLPISLALCATVAQANDKAINQAINLAKSFTGIMLYRCDGDKREAIYSSDRKSAHVRGSNFENYFHGRGVNAGYYDNFKY